MTKKNKLLVLLFIVVISSLWLLSKLDFWTIKKIQVKNNAFVTTRILTNRVSTQNYGDNILYYPSAKVRKVLMDNIPQLRRVTIRKNIFTHTLTVKVKEKEPFVNIIFYPNYYVVSEEGILLNVDPSGNVYDLDQLLELPILTGIEESLLINQKKLPLEYTQLLNRILRKFFSFFGKETLKLDVSSKHDIVVMTDDIFDIKIGDIENIDEKLKVFKVLFKKLKDKKDDILYIDVRYPAYPVVKYVY